MAFNFLRPGAPHVQPLVDLPAAKSAIFVAVLNAGIHLLPCHRQPVEYDRLFRLANYATAMLGVRLLAASSETPFWPWPPAWTPVVAMLGVRLLAAPSEMTFWPPASTPVVAMLGVAFWPPAWAPVDRWMVWTTKVLTGVTLTYSLSVVHSCLRRMYARPLFDWLSHGFYHHFFLIATIVFLFNLLYGYSVYCYELKRIDIE